MSPKLLKVLQIEDNPSDAFLLRELVKHAAQGSVELEVAERLSAGLEKLKAGNYDLVLLDLGLPDGQGIETFDRLHAEMPDLAVVILSGLDDEETSIEAVKRGAQDYLVKGEENGRTLLRAMRYAIERKRLRNDLTQERDLLHAIINSLPDHIYFKNMEGRFERVNYALARFFGVDKPVDMLGRTDFDFLPAELAQQFRDEERRIMVSGESAVNREACISGSRGNRHWVLTTKVPFKNRGGVVIGTVGINRDVTSIKEADERLRAANTDLQKAHQELRDAQIQLIEVEKFQAAGRVAAGVAHQVKNPLAVALRGVEFLSGLPVVSTDTMAGIVLQDMKDAIRRAEGVIRGMQDFAAPHKLVAEPQDVNELLERVLLLMKPELDKQKVLVDRVLAQSLPRCRLDAHKTQGVFFNVVENAIHAMPEGGTLSIRTSQQIITGVGTNIGDRRGYQFGMGDNVVVIEILDTGPGIPEDKLQKIFDPFFTTKPTGVGIGLGLSVAKTTVELEGGTIEISNRPEGGAKVIIMFPSDVGEKWIQQKNDPPQSY